MYNGSHQSNATHAKKLIKHYHSHTSQNDSLPPKIWQHLRSIK